ncbi:VOC family protein [Actinoplanes sp. NPDC049316]|uniref:VOC family protein n=1 Tax=Actinoplanes sp. NPDC049316 TaxID=3154727 RepID=UPI0034484D55
MTSRIATIAIDALDPRRIADFWIAVLGWTVLEESDGIVTIGPADAAWPAIDVVPVPERKSVKNRLHLDLRADGSTAAEEVDRLIGLGARRADVGQAPDSTWVVLADPEGNEFCILSRTVQEVMKTEKPRTS